MFISDLIRLLRYAMIMLFALSINSVYSQICNEDDWTALRALYLSTDGDNWVDTAGWTPLKDYTLAADYNASGGDCSTLSPYGVAFSGGRVETVILNINNLSGPIPSEIGLLSELTYLNLYSNNLTGAIPGEIGDLNALTSLHLGSNQLSGNIPTTIGNLTNLSNLYFSHNNLEGAIPPSFGNLSNLNSFYINNNDLSGCFDSDLSDLCGHLGSYLIDLDNNFDASWDDFCNNGDGNCDSPAPPCNEDDWTALRALYLSTDGDNWTDTTDWTPYRDYATSADYNASGGDCSTLAPYGVTFSGGRVIEVELWANGLDGSLPASINLLSELTKLNLSTSHFPGPIPPEIGDLSELTHLILGSCSFTGPIPASFVNLTQLVSISLLNNDLYGSIPSFFGSISTLQSFAVSQNDLTGTIPSSLGGLPNLSYFSVIENNLEGTIPASFGDLSGLEYFYINDNDLSGCFDSNLANLCGQLAIYSIDAGNNFDASWDDFCSSGDGNCDPPAPPCNEGDWTALRALYLSTDGDNWTDTTGWTPYRNYATSADYNASGGDCSTLVPYGVTFSGGRVIEVDLSANQLDGTIPPEISQLSELQTLNLGFNNLSGSIPSGIGQLSGLTLLNLSGGDFPGPIPSEIGQLTNLENLYLQSCEFTGSIPASFANLANLEDINLSSNNLTGFIPSFFGNLANLNSFTAFSNDLEGSIPEEFGNLSNLTNLHISSNNLSGCFDSNLSSLCGQLQLSSAYFINYGNNFDASWDDFCTYGITACCETDPPVIHLEDEISIDVSEVEDAHYSVSDASDYTVDFDDSIIRRYCADSYDIYREYTVTDNCGNIAVAGHTIRVRDNEGPKIKEQTGFLHDIVSGDTVHLLDCIHPDISAKLFSIEDNSGKYSMKFSVYPTELPQERLFGMMRMYQYEVEVADQCGNTTSLDFYLVLYDIHPPVFRNTPSDVVWDCDESGVGNYVPYPEALDVCDYVAQESMEKVPIIDSKGDTVATVERWTARDPSGNQSYVDVVRLSCDRELPSLQYVRAQVVLEKDWQAAAFQSLVTPSGTQIWPEGAVGTDGILFFLYRIDTISGDAIEVDSMYSGNWQREKGSIFFGPLPQGVYQVRLRLPEHYTPESGAQFDSTGYSPIFRMEKGVDQDLGLTVLVKDTAIVSDSISAPRIIISNSMGSIKRTNDDTEIETASSWELYPNPSSGFVRLVTPNGIDCEYKLINSLGLTVKKGVVSGESALELSGYPAGVYLLKLKAGDRSLESKKLILN